MREILTQEDMEKPRTPAALSEWFNCKYQEIGANKEERKRARMHEGLYKYFVPEIYPLVLYSLFRIPCDSVMCKPQIGNQGFDATIWPIGQPKSIHTVEVTWPQNGQDHKCVAEMMNQRSWGPFKCGDEMERYNQDVHNRVLNHALVKSHKDYRSPGGSTLLIVVDTECSPLSESKRHDELKTLAAEIGKESFLVDSVYLVATPHEAIYPAIEPALVPSLSAADADKR